MFEKKDTAEVEKCYTSKLKTMISKIGKSKTKLVFVNACHSEEVGKVFLEAGIPYVIAV